MYCHCKAVNKIIFFSMIHDSIMYFVIKCAVHYGSILSLIQILFPLIFGNGDVPYVFDKAPWVVIRYSLFSASSKIILQQNNK